MLVLLQSVNGAIVWTQGNTNHVLFMHGKVTRPGLRVLPHSSTWVVVVSLDLRVKISPLERKQSHLSCIWQRGSHGCLIDIMSSSYISALVLCQVLAKMLLKISCGPRCCALLPLAGLHMSTSSLPFGLVFVSRDYRHKCYMSRYRSE